EPRNQRTHLLHVPPTANRLDRERRERRGTLRCQRRHGSDLPPRRRRHLPERQRVDAGRQTAGLCVADRAGLIRIGLPMPAGAEFEVTSVDDPYKCNTNPATGLTSKTAGIVSIYRRPLPSTNLGFLSTVMWDGREPDLTSQ